MSTSKLHGTLSFIPINKDYQKSLASLLNLPVIKAHENTASKPLNSPMTTWKIQGDGNCLFRALSYVVTGRQIYHTIIRHKTIQHMSTIECILKPHMNSSFKEYLSRTKMSHQGTWGSDIELLAASHLLDTDIFVYTKSGRDYKWNKFSKSMLDGSLPKNKCAIYINHTGGVHYDVVLDVCSDASNKIPNEDNSLKHSESNQTFDFIPMNKNSQMSLASLLNLPVIKAHENTASKPLNSPMRTWKIQGDGNCLFRALSYVVTGRQIYHTIIRHKTIQHMSTIECILKPHMNSSFKEYLSRTKMSHQGTWGSDIELLAASHLLDTDIFVYTKSGRDYKWNKFSKSMLDGSLPKNKCAIYINHTGGVHYDVVLDVCSDASNKIPNEGNMHAYVQQVGYIDLSNDFTTKLTSTSHILRRKATTEMKFLDTKKRRLEKSFCDQNSLQESQKSSGNKCDLKKQNVNSDTVIAEAGLIDQKADVFSINMNTESSTQNPCTKKRCSNNNNNTFEKYQQSTGNSALKKSKIKDDRLTKEEHLSELEDEVFSNTFLKVETNPVQNISKFHKSMKYIIHQCKVCFEAWPITRKKKLPNAYTCQRCSRDKALPKKFSNENYMIPSTVPLQLQGLTQVEEMLIARAIPIMRVYVKPGGQRGYSGHCINLPQQISELAQTLPRYAKEIPLILVTMNGKDNTYKDVIVRREKVHNALIWLVNNNPLYKDIEISNNALDALPVNGVPNDLQSIDTTIDNHSDSNVDVQSEDEEQIFDKNTETSSFLPEVTNDQLEHDAIKNDLKFEDKLKWPTIGKEPLNEYSTPFLATMAFPTLFPDGKGDPTNPSLNRDVSLSVGIQHLIKFAEYIDNRWVYRFANHPRFSYWALNMIQRSRTLQQSTIFLKQNPGESHLTIDELYDMANLNSSSVFMSKLSRYLCNITGSSAYWHKVREDLKAIISYKEAPTIFFTFSSADMHWPDLHSLFNEDPLSLSSEDRRQNVINNPHLVDWYFTKRFESFLKHWLYDTLGAEWHWYRYEFQARGSIHCHGTAKLKSDPGLCALTDIALKGFLAEQNILSDEENKENLIKNGKRAAQQICAYVDLLLSTYNPTPPASNWVKPNIHPCKRKHDDIPSEDRESDYADLLNTVQRHTHCSPNYCLKKKANQDEVQCRFHFPFECCDKTILEFEKIHTKDNSLQYKAKIVTRRNDPRLNNHQPTQLVGWRANCDIQVIIDHHACIEYLSKYAAKGEPRSPMLKDTFNAVMKNVNSDNNPQKVIKKIMMKTLGERDFSAQETMHLLLSLKMYGTTFTVLPINLNASRRIDLKSTDNCTKDSLMDLYANRIMFCSSFPDVMNLNFFEFATKFKAKKDKLEPQSPNVVPRIFPTYSPNPHGDNYSMYCKYQLLKYKPWKNQLNDAWGSVEPNSDTLILAWHKFLETAYAQDHVPNWEVKLQQVNSNLEQSEDDSYLPQPSDKEEWMILSDFHNSNISFSRDIPKYDSFDWQKSRLSYTDQQIGEMPNWIQTNKQKVEQIFVHKETYIDLSSFSEQQQLAYNIIVHLHSHTNKSDDPLLLIIIGVAGTGKSYLINAISANLEKRCVVTATTGKASFNINGVTIHSFLKLPVAPNSYKDLSGKGLVHLQEKLLDVDYIIIDEYSMLGQTTFGWIDRRCRQATGLKQHLFGGKSIILIGDPAQLPPVCDKPLYHSQPSNAIGEQGHFAYLMFDKVVVLTENHRVKGSDPAQTSFKELLSRLRNGETTESDWNCLLSRQPLSIKDICSFESATRLFYSNEDVATFNYNELVKLQCPIAQINARHSCDKAKKISAQDLYGLEPSLFLKVGAVVMLTMNLWPTVGLCNGSTGTVVDIVYSPDSQPPDLPIAVIVNFDNYSGPSFLRDRKCVPIPPITATVNIGNVFHERQQLPLKLAWALTIHKSQGLTLKKAWINIGKKESTLGISYVAMSRVRSFTSLIIEPMTFARLKSIKTLNSLKFRKEEETRLQYIANQTVKAYQC